MFTREKKNQKTFAGLGLGLATVLWCVTGMAATPGQDPDWPCFQRKVPTLSAGTYWPNFQAGTDWKSDQPVANLVWQVAPRDVSAEDGIAKLDSFADGVPADKRAAILPELFGGVVDATNEERGTVMRRIVEIGHRQKSVADVVAKLNAQIEAIPKDATGDDAKTLADLTQHRDLVIRMFQETQRTMRYACEAPVALDARLGQYAKALQAKLGE